MEKILSVEDIRFCRRDPTRIVAAPKWAFPRGMPDTWLWREVIDEIAHRRTSRQPERCERVKDVLTLDYWATRYRSECRCTVCGQEFYAIGPIKICSNRCLAIGRSRHPRVYRRVHHDPQPCLQCGSDFIPKRKDAQFCSGKCRVAHHRSNRN